MPIWGYCGKLGSGKTTGLVAHLLDFKHEGFDVKTYGVKTTFGEILDIEEILNFELENCVLGLSEAYTLLDSRINTNAERNITYFVLQSRKRHVHIVYDAQLMTSVDLRLRFLTDHVILCEKDWDGEYKRNPETNILEEVVYGFYYTCFDRGEIMTSQKYISIEDAKTLVFPNFDSYEVVMPIGVQDQNMTMDKIKSIFEDCNTKDSFVSVFKSESPFTSLQTCKSVYDLLLQDKPDRVARLLRIKSETTKPNPNVSN
jgi:hypothetical protein